MNDEEITIDVIIPKSIGSSLSLSLPSGSTILEVLYLINHQELINKIVKNETEFSGFVLVYVNKQRTKDPSMRLKSSSAIEIIIPMAGG
ncbi:hypothetical protein [Pseudescherichia sp.]|uniref:hypothetical protein n=1 Tax=Pseudescherichia sp. TaxID=2055881 RepID=UPI00289F5F68|nr:hypothetical protein [Pseudescherichia sp.]